MGRRASLRVADVVRISLSSSVARFDASEPALWSERDPEAVHQARVATRRLRSDLRTMREHLDLAWAEELRGELRWLGAELGALRDIEVLRERLERHAALLPDPEADAARRALRRLDAPEAAARNDLLGARREPRFEHLRRALHEAAVSPRCMPAAEARAVDALPEAVRPVWRKLHKAVDALGPDPSDAALHEVRIRAKRCRYASETAAIAVGKPAARLATALGRVQDLLGRHHDGVVARAWLAKTAPECGAAEAYALGMLAELERDFAERERAAFGPLWRAARKPARRAWM